MADPAWRTKDAAAFSPQASLVKLSAVLAPTDRRRGPERCGEAAIVRHDGSVIKARRSPERRRRGLRRAHGRYLLPAKERTRHGVQQRHFPVLLPAVVPPGLLRDALQQMGSGGVQHRFLCLGRADLRRAAVCVDRHELRARAEDRARPRLRPGPALGRRRHRPQPDPAAAVQVQRLRDRDPGDGRRPVAETRRQILLRPAARHLVLHLPRALVPDRRLPRRRAGRAQRPRLSRCTSPCSRSSSPGRSIRYKTSPAQLAGPRDRHRADGVRHSLFVIGLVKKVADRRTRLARSRRRGLRAAARTSSRRRSPGSASSATRCQIYFDFSGYSDMAIGLGAHDRLQLPEQFQLPLHRRVDHRVLAPLAHLPVDLVPRLPLHPARRQPARRRPHLRQPADRVPLCGLWHGAAWTFVLWGAAHGAFLVLERLGLGRLVARVPPPCSMAMSCSSSW